MTLSADQQLDPTLASATGEAIRAGDLPVLRHLLQERPGLAATRIGPRTLLHVATDWPGHFPNVVDTIRMLLEAGADVNAPFVGGHHERPLHWAASSDDVAALDVLLDAGGDIEAEGGMGTPLADAVRYGQWRAARRLVERGARPNLWQAAALGLTDQLRAAFEAGHTPSPSETTKAFWCACHGGQRESAELLLANGAELNWIGHDRLTPLDAARRSGAGDLAAWLVERGARSSSDAQQASTT